jgi:hypothetical protein
MPAQPTVILLGKGEYSLKELSGRNSYRFSN